MLLRISIFLLLLPFIAGQSTWSASSSVDDTTIAAIHNILHLPLTQIQNALESQNQMREELTRVSNLSATVEDTAIAAVRNILHLPLTQIQIALESQNQMREEVTSLASQVLNLSATVSTSVEHIAIAAVRNILHLPLTQIQNALESQNQMREEVTSLASQVSNLLATGCPKDGTHLFKDCSQLYQAGYRESGVYVMHILDAGQTIPINISCDMETDGGGWLVFQRRQDGSVDFYRDWISYVEGFGNITGEFWLGNKLLHQLTDQKPQQLRIDLHDHEGHTAYAKYGNFYVGPEMTKFTLNISGYSGTAGDGMPHNNNRMFSTKDQDNDSSDLRNCAITWKGAWWYGFCTFTNLNGQYAQTGISGLYVTWRHWLNNISLKFTEMKIRPQDF